MSKVIEKSQFALSTDWIHDYAKKTVLLRLVKKITLLQWTNDVTVYNWFLGNDKLLPTPLCVIDTHLRI